MFKEKDGIATVDAAQLLDPKERKMADSLRTVEPSIKLKKTVSKSLHPLFTACMRKTLHFQSLDADPWFVLDCPATMRAIFIHSYSDCRIDLANTSSSPRQLLTCIRMTNNRLVQTGSIFQRLYLLHS